MAKTIIITNGTGSEELINGTYSVTAEINGYDNTSILPNSVEIVEGTNNYSFTISATGTLTLNVTDGSGTPIVGAKFIRTDSLGNEYGNIITSDSSGNAVFNNVPWGENAPLIYYKQTESDGEHEFISTVQDASLTTQTSTVSVINQPGVTRTINLTDANYDNLIIETGSITLTN